MVYDGFMNANAIDAQLTGHLNLLNTYLSCGTDEGLARARMVLSSVIGMLTMLSPDDPYTVNTYQRHLLEVTDEEEFCPLQRAVFNDAFARLGTLAS